ncbi:hypothetical protein LM602_00470 [Candidatus Acetothermia bacterium]|jgi:hypothetical protein|nr:hypothetical protein [Candidatus Acetothermia bacterium]MCI2431022.1 hypothetical protein [Candidatus Acetothermia bacterium]MCI2436918.1 hypothetical protein [Candidatus Acetothermia bacterium]
MNVFTQAIFFLGLLSFGALLMGTALTPGIRLLFEIAELSESWPAWGRAFALGLGVMIGYFSYGFALMTLIVLISRLLPKPTEGEYPYFSGPSILWFLNDAILFPASKTFIDFVPLSGINILYYRLLGAKIGRGVQLNAQLIDCWLVEIEDNVVIGGGTVIVCHVAEGGRLKLKRVKIGRGATVGMGTHVMPGAEIGEEALVGAHSVVLSNKRIPARTIWVGVPVRPVRKHRS